MKLRALGFISTVMVFAGLSLAASGCASANKADSAMGTTSTASSSEGGENDGDCAEGECPMRAGSKHDCKDGKCEHGEEGSCCKGEKTACCKDGKCDMKGHHAKGDKCCEGSCSQ